MKTVSCRIGKQLAFLFSLEAAFSLTLVLVASAYLLAFSPQKEDAGKFLACSDAAGVFIEMRAFSSQDALNASVSEAGALMGACLDAESGGLGASSCAAGGGTGEKYSFSFPIWKNGRVENAGVECQFGT